MEYLIALKNYIVRQIQVSELGPNAEIRVPIKKYLSVNNKEWWIWGELNWQLFYNL